MSKGKQDESSGEGERVVARVEGNPRFHGHIIFRSIYDAYPAIVCLQQFCPTLLRS